MQLLTTDQALTQLGEEFIEAVVVSQRSKGLRASGRSANSLRLEVTGSGTIKRLQLFGLARWRFQESGRGPGRYKYPSRKMVASIAEWIKDKGLNIPAYPVAVKINRDGIKVPNDFNSGGVLSEPLNADRVRSLAKAKLRPIIFQSAKSTFFS